MNDFVNIVLAVLATVFMSVVYALKKWQDSGEPWHSVKFVKTIVIAVAVGVLLWWQGLGVNEGTILVGQAYLQNVLGGVMVIGLDWLVILIWKWWTRNDYKPDQPDPTTINGP